MNLKMNKYERKILRIKLSRGEISDEILEETTLKDYPGGTCLGAKILYDEVPPGVGWADPENRLILASGPLGGTKLPGSGTFTAVTKGALTEGAAASQANGFFGAYLKLAGYTGIVIGGASENPVYLYIDQNGKAELRDSAHLAGKDTWETEAAIKEELGFGDKEMSVFGIGPAGENLVRFACVVGDKGHVAAHNGIGAVIGSKKLKAVAIARSGGEVPVHDPEAVSELAKKINQITKSTQGPYATHHLGTSGMFSANLQSGVLPIKNYMAFSFPDEPKFKGERIREVFDTKPQPCWRCPQHHCHMMKVTEGPYAGYEGEEPEYEQWAAFGSIIGNTDPGAALVLANEGDRLGMDANESGWLLGWVMECYEKGLLSSKDLDGLELTWGNVEAVRALLKKIAFREGAGEMLSQGVMRAARQVGGEAANCAVHTMKGNTPRGHDHRCAWTEMFITSISNSGTLEERAFMIQLFEPEQVVDAVTADMGAMYFEDSMGICWFNMGLPGRFGQDKTLILQAVKAATGWDLSWEDSLKVGRRAVNLMRAFNYRHGITAELDAPSPRYGSAPADGPAKDRSIMPNWKQMLTDYYRRMGWDTEKGIPLPGTLKTLGLEHVVSDIW